MRLEATIISDILFCFGQGILFLSRQKSGNFEKLCVWKPWFDVVLVCLHFFANQNHVRFDGEMKLQAYKPCVPCSMIS